MPTEPGCFSCFGGKPEAKYQAPSNDPPKSEYLKSLSMSSKKESSSKGSKGNGLAEISRKSAGLRSVSMSKKSDSSMASAGARPAAQATDLMSAVTDDWIEKKEAIEKGNDAAIVVDATAVKGAGTAPVQQPTATA